MKISVLPFDIQNGVRGNACRCPIARALQRAFPGAPGIWVSTYTQIVFTADEEHYAETNMPPAAVAFMRAFDDGKPVGPLEFDVTLR